MILYYKDAQLNIDNNTSLPRESLLQLSPPFLRLNHGFSLKNPKSQASPSHLLGMERGIHSTKQQVIIKMTCGVLMST